MVRRVFYIIIHVAREVPSRNAVCFTLCGKNLWYIPVIEKKQGFIKKVKINIAACALKFPKHRRFFPTYSENIRKGAWHYPQKSLYWLCWVCHSSFKALWRAGLCLTRPPAVWYYKTYWETTREKTLWHTKRNTIGFCFARMLQLMPSMRPCGTCGRPVRPSLRNLKKVLDSGLPMWYP